MTTATDSTTHLQDSDPSLPIMNTTSPANSQPDAPPVSADKPPGANPPTEQDLIESVTKLHHEIMGYANRSLEAAIMVGEQLTQLKADHPHGTWLPFVEQRLPFRERTARRYMELFEGRSELLLKSASLTDLNLEGAYQVLRKGREKKRLIVAKGPPETTHQEVPPSEEAMDVDDARDENDAPTIDIDVQAVRLPPVVENPGPGLESARPAQVSPSGEEVQRTEAPSVIGEAPECDEEGDPFLLADGSELPFEEWRPGLLRDDSIRNQLTFLNNVWHKEKSPASTRFTAYAQKLTVHCGTAINRSLPENPTVDLVGATPDLLDAVAQTLKKLHNDAIDEAFSCLNNIIRSGPGFPRPEYRTVERDDEDRAAA